MALVLADRVQETSITAGTGTLTLAGAVTGFQSFSVIGNANTTYYTISDPVTGDWEVGIGTYTASGTTLSRTTVLSSSNAGALVVFAGNVKNVFVTYPAGKAIFEDASGNTSLPGDLNVAGTGINLSGSNAGIELGSNTVNTPYIDFHSSANTIDYDARIIASGGTSTAGNGALLFVTSGFGYGTGSGGTVTQLTSKSTAVTLNKPTGRITMNNALLATGGVVSFNLANTFIAIGDVVTVTPSGFTGPYRCTTNTTSAGNCTITIQNNNAAGLSDALVINFAVIKVASA